MATSSQRCEGDSGEGRVRRGDVESEQMWILQICFTHCCETLDRLFCYLTEY